MVVSVCLRFLYLVKCVCCVCDLFLFYTWILAGVRHFCMLLCLCCSCSFVFVCSFRLFLCLSLFVCCVCGFVLVFVLLVWVCFCVFL